MSAKKKIAVLEKFLKKKLSAFKLKKQGRDPLSGNYFFRYRGEKQGLRIEFRESVIEGQPAKDILARLEKWSPPKRSDSAVRVYDETIGEIPWDSELTKPGAPDGGRS
jgi:hypothetical protein